MSMYGLIFGENAAADVLLKLLALSKDDFFRYRDCYLSEGNKIAVYTRGGGGNRECWMDECGDDSHVSECVVTKQSTLRKHPLYVNDSDDEFDNTYATFYFRLPEHSELDGIAPEPDRNKMWLEFLAALQSQSAKANEGNGPV